MREKPRGIANAGRRPRRSTSRAPSPAGATARGERLERFPSPPFSEAASGPERPDPAAASTKSDPTSEPREAADQRPKPPEALHTSICESETQTQTQPNTALQLTNTDAAQSAILSLCLLSVLAAECHVGQVRSESSLVMTDAKGANHVF